MATAQELKNEARELLSRASAALAEGNQEAYDRLFAEFAVKDQAQQEAYKKEQDLKAAFDKYAPAPSDPDLRRPEDAMIPSIKAENARTGILVQEGMVVPFATKDSEGYIKNYPAAVQHPSIMKRYTPEMRAEADFTTRAWVKWFRKGPSALDTAELKAMQEMVDAEGGFLVPTDQVKLPYIHDSGAMGGVTRPISSNFTTSRDSGFWPTVGSVLWAPVAEEGALPTTTDPVFDQVDFNIRKIMGMHKVSQELLEDSAVDIGSIISLLYNESLGRYEDQQAIEGDGTTEPEGLRTASVADITDLITLAAPTAAEIINAYFELPANFRSNATWHTTSSFMARVYGIGAATAGIHFINEPANGAPTLSLLGRPVVMFDGTGWDGAATISADEELGAFGDFRNYYFINRVGMSIRRLNELYAGNDQVGFVARIRYDSVVALTNSFRIIKAAAS